MFMNDEKPKDLHECFERMKKACETLENEYGYSKYAKFNPPLTEKEIQDLEEYESRLGFKLPEAYREFLKFSNGAIIDELKIYELGMIGMPDDYVPDDFLPITSIECVPERMAISMEDGNIYMFWEGVKEDCDFEYQLMQLLEKCEECIIEHAEEARKALRTPEQIKQDEEEIQAVVDKWKKFLAERKKQNKWVHLISRIL
ncbi:MAG: SMI1/KNR4 family protein [Ruminococcus sp.]|nr:SMI1/KNR4 family protein [Ruminococcus sp.]